MRSTLLLLLLLGLAACDPGQEDLKQLASMQATADPRANAKEEIACDARDAVCVRLLIMRGSACASLTEVPDGAERARYRSCALSDFRKARTLLPEEGSVEDRRKTLIGLADALKMARDNDLNATAAVEANSAIAAVVSDLGKVPGGQPYASYFGADADVFRVQYKLVPEAEVCATLASASKRLPRDVNVPIELEDRIRSLQSNITEYLPNNCK